ncbi:MAG: DUF1292 domain-containing protein [Bacilli bacterium]|nr:DUF1292 domain-containing protein [Bacilli bacterium]
MGQDKLEIMENGQTITCDIYFSFVCNETHKGYIAYTDHSLAEDGKENLFVSTYDPSVGTSELGEVTDEKEWDLIRTIMEKIQNLK